MSPSRSFDPGDREREINSPQLGDDDPACLTRFQMQKIACIIDARLDGHELWHDPAIAAVHFLHATAAEAGGAVTRPSAAERWVNDLATLPWPPSGKPRPQPDGAPS